MMEFENPIFNEDLNTLDDDDFPNSTDESYIEDPSDDASIDTDTICCKKITYSGKNEWRYGPIPLEGSTEICKVKIGSLQGNDSDDAHKVGISSLTTSEAANLSLLQYFVNLGTTDESHLINISFLETVLPHADINVCDIHGQTLMHEIAREWHPDVAAYMKRKGINIDVEDNWGRTPLFVAVSANNELMINWLLQNGAAIDHRTITGEGQQPIHYAAKFGSIKAFDILLDHGANPLSRDGLDQTPMFLAAAAGDDFICNHLLAMELPVASYNIYAVSAIDNFINNLPTTTVLKALDQFVSINSNKKYEKYYVSCLGKKRFNLLLQKKNANKSLPKIIPLHPLELINEQRNMDLIMHPIILKYVKLASSRFAQFYIRLNMFIAFLFTVLWTIGNTMGADSDMWSHKNIIIFVFSTMAQFVGFYQSYELYISYQNTKNKSKKESERRLKEIMKEEKLCHPRWPIDEVFLQIKREHAQKSKLHFWNLWNCIEAICLVASLGQWIVALLEIVIPSHKYVKNIHKGYCSVFVLLIWLRFNRYVRHIQALGPLITMMRECFLAVVKLTFLFFEFYIPFSILIWILFGQSKGADNEYKKLGNAFYQVYLLSIIGDYDYDTLKEKEEWLAQIVVGFYMIIVSIITMNLVIALLTEAFQRVYQCAKATAYMNEAEKILDIARRFPHAAQNFEEYLNKECAPLVVNFPVRVLSNDRGARDVVQKLHGSITTLAEQMKSYTKEFVGMKNSYDQTYKALHKLHGKFTPTEKKTMYKRLNDALAFNTNRLIRTQRTTANKFSRFMQGFSAAAKFNTEPDDQSATEKH